jgi:rhamnosyltransferase subunit B
MSRPRILIATFGSLGDLHPFVALGQALAREGFAPVIATSEAYGDFIRGEGLDFAPVRPDADDLTGRLGMDLGAIARRMAEDDRFLFETLIFPSLRDSFDDLYAAAEGAVCVVAHGLAFAARYAAEARGLPAVTVLLSPLMLYAADDPPIGSRVPFTTAPVGRLGVAWNRLLLSSLAHAIAHWAGPLRRLRREVGLPPRRGAALFLGDDSVAATIGLFSPLLTQATPGGGGARIAGHSFHDRYLERGAIDPALDAFLRDGEPPVVFTLGSFVARARQGYYRDCLAASRALGRRALLLAHEDDVADLIGETRGDAFVAAYAPHSQIFPRACAVVHHGGIGTAGQALRAGRPQLVTPFLGDQFDNAGRLRRLGVARVVPGATATAATLAAALAGLDAGHTRRAAACAREIRAEDGAAVAAKWISEIPGLRPGTESPPRSPALADAAPPR